MVDIAPDRVERLDPPTAVVALLDRDIDLTLGRATDADMCARQPFFASPNAAAQWLAEHPDGRLVAVRDFHVEARRLVDWLEATRVQTGEFPVAGRPAPLAGLAALGCCGRGCA